MKTKNFPRAEFLLPAIILCSLLISQALFSQAKTTAGQEGVLLQYNYPSGGIIKYLNNSKMTQTMDINGQPMEVHVTSSLGCSIKALENDGKSLRLEVTVDTLGQTTDSPMGYSGGAISDVIGKSFDLTIAPNGKGIDMSEAEKVVYTIEGSGESNLSASFANYFPVLPSKAVKPGDTWNATDTIRTHTSSMNMTMVVNAESKLAGIEEVDGRECARITSMISGTQDISVQNQGVDLKLKGPYTGTIEFLFSIRDGYFISNKYSTKLTGNVDMSMPQPMSMPIVMDMNEINEIRK